MFISFLKSLEKGRKEGNVLFNDTLNTFYFTVKWRNIMVWVIWWHLLLVFVFLLGVCVETKSKHSHSDRCDQHAHQWDYGGGVSQHRTKDNRSLVEQYYGITKITIYLSIYCFNVPEYNIVLSKCVWSTGRNNWCPKGLKKLVVYLDLSRKEMGYLMMHSTHFIYCYMASSIW